MAARFTIRNKILSGFVIAAVVPVLILGAISNIEVQHEFEEQQLMALDAIADLKKKAVENFFQDFADETMLVSELTTVKEAFPIVNEYYNKRETRAYKVIREDLDSHLIPIRDSKNLLEIILANPEGQMVYNTGKVHNDEELGMVMDAIVTPGQFDENQTLHITHVFESPYAPSGFEMASALPVYNDETLLGIVILATDMAPIFNLILERTGLGETGETLIGRSEGEYALFINPLKYDPDAALKRKVLYSEENALPIREATQGIDGSGVTTDYRDEEIVASWRALDLPSPELSWGLVAKVDTSEAFAINREHAQHTAIIGFFSLIPILLVAIYIGRSISRPLFEVGAAAQKIATGDLGVRIAYKGNDEIGDMSQSFNRMTDQLVESQSNLDKKNEMLEGSVKELEKKNKEIDRSKRATLNILEDVQEEKEKTQQEKDRIATILNSIGDGVFVVDVNHTIQEINPVAADLAGYTEEEALGKPYKEILHFIYEDTRAVNDRFVVDAIRTGETQEMANHTLLIRSDGKEIPVADSAAPLKDLEGNVTGCVVVFRDVSKEHAIDKAKTEFVSLASHQLRTPLAAINWNIEMLLDDALKKLNKDQKQSLEDVYASGQRMTELVNSLLNVSRLELGTFTVEPEPTDIINLAKDVVKELEPKIKEKELKLEEEYASKELVMSIDPKLTRMIIENLLSNAVKYTPDKKGVRLCIRKEAKELVIEVSDEGYGIPKDQQSKIFTRLFRADNVRVMDMEGTGLGLYIVKSIVEHAGGEIWFESEENKGTAFYVKLPLTGMVKKEGDRRLM